MRISFTTLKLLADLGDKEANHIWDDMENGWLSDAFFTYSGSIMMIGRKRDPDWDLVNLWRNIDMMDSP